MDQIYILSISRFPQVLGEGTLDVTMASSEQTYSAPGNMQVVTLDVDGSNVGWSSSQEEGATEEVRDQDGWVASQNTNNAEVLLSLGLSLSPFMCVCVRIRAWIHACMCVCV